MSALRAVLLDIDGTLLDSNDAHARAWVDAFVEARIAVDAQQIRTLIGKGGDRVLREAAGLEKNEEPGKTIDKRSKAIFAERYLPSLRPTLGARELLVWLRSREMQLVVATSASQKETRLLLEAAGVADLIDDAASSSDASESKPAPDILSAALQKAGRGAAECVMIGDSPYDCEAAERAGISAIALRCGGWDKPDLRCEAVFDDPADLKRRYRESPLRRLDRASALDAEQGAG